VPKRLGAIAARLLLSAAGSVSPLPLCAQTPPVRPSVQVIFRVEANRYVGHFGTDLPQVSHDAGERFATKLEENFAFLHFTTSTAPIRLTITLADRSPSQTCMGDPDCFKETVFRLQLDQQGLPSIVDDTWIYMGITDYLIALAGVAEEVENFERVGFSKLDANRLVGSLFSNISLSSTAHLLWEQNLGSGPPSQQLAGLTLPLPAVVVCADQDSVLRLSSVFPFNFTMHRSELPVDTQGGFIPPQNPPDPTWSAEIGNLFGVPSLKPPNDRNWDDWAALRQSDKTKIQVKGVYMHAYRRPDTGSCSPAIPPDSSGIRLEGVR
jgi:hypothetical protein